MRTTEFRSVGVYKNENVQEKIDEMEEKGYELVDQFQTVDGSSGETLTYDLFFQKETVDEGNETAESGGKE